MQFFEVETAYRLHRKDYGYKDGLQFYKDALIDAEAGRHTGNYKFDFFNQVNSSSVMVDSWWESAKKPYYKIWPGVFDTFIKTRLDIKAELLRFPHDVYAILLPKTDEPLLSFDVNDGLSVVESIIVSGFDLRDDGMVGITFKVIYRTEGYEFPGSFIRLVKMSINDTIEQGIEIQDFHGLTRDGRPHIIPGEIMDACVRLIVATTFLATGSHKVLEYDVLSKHLNAYREIREENAAKRKEYEDKAKAKGKFGWNIGSGRGDRGLKLPNGTSYAKACKEAGGREHLYQHVRGGHWHTVRYGEGRKDVKIVWFEETTVRKDLPPKPINA